MVNARSAKWVWPIVLVGFAAQDGGLAEGSTVPHKFAALSARIAGGIPLLPAKVAWLSGACVNERTKTLLRTLSRDRSFINPPDFCPKIKSAQKLSRNSEKNSSTVRIVGRGVTERRC